MTTFFALADSRTRDEIMGQMAAELALEFGNTRGALLRLAAGVIEKTPLLVRGEAADGA